MKFTGMRERMLLREARKRKASQGALDIQQQAISRALGNQKKDVSVPETFNRTMFYRNPNNPKEIKVINRIYNPYLKDWKMQVATNWHVASPTPDMQEISPTQMQQLMKMKDAIPF